MKRLIEKKLAALPKEPGVYLFKNTKRQIIYVGKAAVLRNRVRSYFQNGARLDPKTQVMVGEIANIEWIVCASEIDALFLESELIKRYKPQYNIELRDDKHYLYVRIPMKEIYPAVTFVRRPLDDGASYFGPFIQSFALRKALRHLRKIFPYSVHETLPKRVCLQYHLGLCPGVEEAKISPKDYKENLRKLMMFLKGERTLLIKQLEKDMRHAANKHEFEQAAKLRNQAHSLRALSSQIVFSDQERFDLTRDQALNGLSKLLGLKGLPRRIEAYDISHISGSDNVASMIVFWDGVPAKGEYRKFKMRTPGNDDFAHMQEVISRRFSGANLKKWAKPDLLVIDGGKAQVNAALSVLEAHKISIPMVGLAKRLEIVIIPRRSRRGRVVGSTPMQPNLATRYTVHSTAKFDEVELAKDSEVLKLLQRMRDEAHRFAITYHSLLRSKRQTASRLEEIPGIGPATRKKLIKHFGSFKGIQQASQKQLSSVLGTKKADLLKQYL